jgi:hypothetical protein
VGPYPGFRVSFRFRLVGMWGAAAGDHEGEPRLHWPLTLWLDTVMSLVVGLECVVFILMVCQCLSWMSRSGHVMDFWHPTGPRSRPAAGRSLIARGEAGMEASVRKTLGEINSAATSPSGGRVPWSRTSLSQRWPLISRRWCHWRDHGGDARPGHGHRRTVGQVPRRESWRRRVDALCLMGRV